MPFVAPENKSKNTTSTAPKTGGFVAPENQALTTPVIQETKDIIPTGEREGGIPTVTLKEEPVKSPLQSFIDDVTTPAKQVDVANNFKLNLFGANIILPRTSSINTEITVQEKIYPYKGLVSANKKEMGLDIPDILSDPFQSAYQTKQLSDKVINEINTLNNSTPDQISEFIQQKKQSLSKITGIEKEAVDLKDYSDVERGAGFIKESEKSIIDSEYRNISAELDAVAKQAAFKTSPIMSTNIDEFNTKPNSDIISVAQQVGNNILNIGDPVNRATFQAKAFLDEQDGGYSQSYKDQLAYTGIQSEIYNTQTQVQELTAVVNERLNEVAELNQLLQQNPTDKSLITQIQQKVEELGPIKTEIDKRKNFITKLSSATLDLPEMSKRIALQNEIDFNFEKYSQSLSTDNPDLLQGGIYAVKGLSNRLLKSAAYGDVALESLLGSTKEQQAIELSSLSELKEFLPTPTKLKEGKVIDYDKQGNIKGINWNIALPMTLQTTGETLAMGAVGAPLATYGRIGQFAGLYAGSTAVFSGDILQSELEKGLPLNEAIAVTGLRLGVEAGTELINPLEFISFNGVAKKVVNPSKVDFTRYVGENWQKLIPKWKAIGLNASSVIFQAAKNVGFESFEEVMSDLGNYGLDEAVIDNIKPDYRRDNEFNMSNELTTALTTALTMLPMGGYSGFQQAKADKQAPNLRWSAAQMPKDFLQNLRENFNKGNITQEFYETGKKEVETISNIYNNNKVKIDAIDKEEQPYFLDALYQYDKISKQILSETNPVKSEELAKELEKAAKIVESFDKEALKNISLTPVEKQEKREDVYIQNIKDFANPEDLKEASLEDLNIGITTLNNVISSPFSPKVAEQAQKHIELINEEIALRQQAQKEIKTLAQKEQEVIQNLSKEAIPSYKIPKEITGEDRKQLVQAKIEREKQLEDEENSVTFSDETGSKTFRIGDLITYQGNNYSVQKNEQGQPILFNKVTNSEVIPSRIADFQEYKPKTTQTTQEPEDVLPVTEEDLNQEFSDAEAVFGKLNIIEEALKQKDSNVESKKGFGLTLKVTNSINSSWNSVANKFIFQNKKNEELTNTKQISRLSKTLSDKPNVINTWWNELLTNDLRKEVIQELNSLKDLIEQGIQNYGEEVINQDVVLMNYLKGIKFKPEQIVENTTDIDKKKWTNENGLEIDTFVSGYLKEELLEYGLNLSEDEIINSIYSLINNYPNGITKKDIDKFAKESDPSKQLIDLENNFTEKFGLDAETVLTKLTKEDFKNYEQVQRPTQSEESVEIIIPKATEAELRAQEELDNIIKQNEEESIKQEVKVVEETKKFETYNPLSTVAPFDDKNGLIGKVAINSTNWLLSQMKSTGKSLQDLGYYITVHDVKDFKPEQLLPEWQQFWEERGISENERKGLVAVVTDVDGKPKLFNEAGEVATEGTMSLHQVRKTFNQPDIKGTKLENWKLDVEKAKKLQESVKPNIPIVIQSTIKAATPVNKRGLISQNFTDFTLSVGAETYLIDKQGNSAQVFKKDKNIGAFPTMAEDIYNFLNINNSEGLPESFIAKSKDEQDVLKAFQNRIAQGVNDVTLKTFPEIFLYSRESQKLKVDPKTGLPFIELKKNGEVTQIKDKTAFINFVNSNQLNLSKRAETSVPLDIYRFKDGKFTTETINYKDFVANNFQVALSTPKGNPHFVFQTAIKKIKPETTTPTEVKPDLEQPQVTTKKKFDFSKIKKAEDTLDDIDSSKGLDRVSSLPQKVTKEQETTAKQWFDKYLSNSGVSLTESQDIANSTAFATWKNGAITLFKGSKYTDLYHEAFHDFTQFFLTIPQKEALYKEAEQSEEGQKAIKALANKLNLNPFDLNQLQKFFALEEMLAEDFYNYQLSGQKLILNKRIKRNTIFRKIYNFLKEIFTGKPSIESLYKQLANTKVNKAQRDPSKALFGKLNKSIPGLDEKNSQYLTKAIDSVFAQKVREKGISMSQIFLEVGELNKAYGTVKNSLIDAAQDLNSQYEVETDPIKESELAFTLSNLQYTLDNWNTVRESHKINSKYLRVDKSLIPEEEITEEGDDIEINDKYGDLKENINPRDNVSQYILYLIASLPKYDNKGRAVYNKFLPNIQDTVDFDPAWNKLLKALQGDKDYNSMIKKLQKLAVKDKSFAPLLESLPSSDEQLDIYQTQLKASFVNALSKPQIKAYISSFEYKKDGKIILQSRDAESTTNRQLINDWNLAIQTEPNEYRKTLPDSTQYEVDVDNILKDFTRISASNSQEFLDALGFQFSQGAKESKELQDVLQIKNNTLKKIFEALKTYRNLQNGAYPKGVIPTSREIEQLSKPIISIVDTISKSIYVDNKALFIGIQEDLQKLMDIELTYSTDYHNATQSNSENNLKYSHKDWSLQSQDNYLRNNIEKFPTYNHLIADPIGAYFNINLNPDANNIYLNSLFILDKSSPKYGERRVITGNKPNQIEVFEQDGIKITPEEGERDGIKTSNLDRFLALIQDIPTLLSKGYTQNMRAGDKATPRGFKVTEFPSFVKDQPTRVNKYLPVDIYDFRNPNELSDQAWFILRNSLIATLRITNDASASDKYDNVANIKTNIKNSPFGKFDKVLTPATKELLGKASGEVLGNVANLVDNHRTAIKKDMNDYFNKISNNLLEELNQNTLIPKENYLPDYILEKADGKVETLIKTFSVNKWILNSEQERDTFQDVRYYNIRVENDKKRNYREPFKRFSKATSTGLTPLNDQQTNEFFNNPESNSFAEKQTYDKNNPNNPSIPYTEQGVANAVIVNDVEFTSEQMIKDLDKYLVNAPESEKKAILKAYKDITTADAMGVSTLDFYRNLKIRIGEEAWTEESEKLYQKIARQEKLTKEEETNSFLFFGPVKYRVAGRVYDAEKQVFVPIDYKFAITPLLPTTVKDSNYDVIRNNMLRQNAHLLLFSSASKHSAIANSGKYNNLYNEDGTPFTGDYVINPTPLEYFFEVVNSPEKYKEEVRFSTQLRTLLFVNLFDNGVPQGFRGTKKDWDKLTEEQKKEQSLSYRRASDFRDSIDEIVQLRKEKLLRDVGAVYNKETDSYTVNQLKFSKLLEREFDSKGLSDNVQSSIQTNTKNEFKYPFDATIARDEIENTILSIIDNRLRKQNVYGESLVQVSNTGFERQGKTIADNTLPFYKDQGRTLKDGTKVTSAHKIKISLQGDFKKLLQHPDVLALTNDTTTPLQALNQLIKDENWLDKGNNREMITLSGVRIPVQGLNSMEFMEVYEFFPTESGSIIAVAPELVAKSGGDFDWDKITSLFPHIYINEQGKVLPVTKLSDNQIEALYDSIAPELKSYLKEYQNSTKVDKDTDASTFLTSNKLISAIFGKDEINQLVEDSFSNDEIPSKRAFISQYKEKVAHNETINIMREVLQDPHNFINLTIPNATYMYEDIADSRKAAQETEKAGYADNYTHQESINQHESNFVGKAALGIGAIANKFFPMMQQVGMYLNNTYKYNLDGKSIRFTKNRFNHNELEIPVEVWLNDNYSGEVLKKELEEYKKDGLLKTKIKAISLSNVWSVEKGKNNKYKISEAISQLMNGWVDVAKKDWIFYINGTKELAPTMLFHLMQGTHKDDVLAFFNQPAIYDYVKTLASYRNPLVKIVNPKAYKSAKASSIYEILIKYIPDNTKITIDNFGKPKKVDLKEELTKLRDNYLLDNSKTGYFLGFINNEMRTLADENQDLFDDTKFNYNKFAFPTDGKIAIPTTNKEKLAQALYLVQLLELQEQTTLFSQMRRTMNNDTAKASSLQFSESRAFEQIITEQHGLFPSNLVKKMINGSTIAAFTNENTGLDKFIKQLTKNIFEVTNNPEFNKFLFSEWKKPASQSFIPFDRHTIDDFNSWVKTFKNDFILYLYDNNVYDEQDNLVASNVVKQMKFETALAHDIDAIKREFPEILANNLFLEYLTKDNSIRLTNGKPQKVNIKLKYDKVDEDTANILSQDFEALMNFQDPNYTPEQQARIQQLAEKVAYFSYVQSGLNKSPFFLAKYIPQEFFAGEIQEVIKKVEDIFNKSPEKAKEILTRFNIFFRANNAKFYQNFEMEDGQPAFRQNLDESYRYKMFIDPQLDLFGKKKALANEKLVKKTTTLPDYTVNLPKENPKTLYIFEDTTKNQYTTKSSKVSIVNGRKGTIDQYPNNILPLYTLLDKTTEFKTIADLQTALESTIKQIRDLSNNFDSIVFPANLFENSELATKNTVQYNFIAEELNNTFGTSYPLIPTDFRISEENVVDLQDMNTTINDPAEFTNYSGAAEGGDKEWEKTGKEFGIGKQVNYRPENLKKLSGEQLKEIEDAYQKAVQDLGRKPLDANSFAGGLVRRDYLQAKAGDAVFAISTILEPNQKDKKGYTNKTTRQVVEGGTGYAVQMAINLGKPVFVFDQIKNQWFTWDNNSFKPTETPILTPKFAGIGTRELNDNGRKAIRDVYTKTFNQNNQEKQDKLGCTDAPF